MFDDYSNRLVLNAGATPGSWACLMLNNYTLGHVYYPIYPGEFEILEVGEISDALLREVEARYKGPEGLMKLIGLEGVTGDLAESLSSLVDAYRLFKAEDYAAAKDEARKALERIKNVVDTWKTVDGSKHLADAMRKLTGALFDICSTGGAHPGIAKRGETEVALYSALYLLKYVNEVLKGERAEVKQE